MHDGLRRFVQHLNWLYVHEPAYYEVDDSSEGFRVDRFQRQRQQCLVLHRKGRNQTLVFVVNATPVVRGGYRLGVSAPGFYEEILNTDAETYGGSNVGNGGGVMQSIGAGRADPIPFWLISRRFPSQASSCALLLPKRRNPTAQNRFPAQNSARWHPHGAGPDCSAVCLPFHRFPPPASATTAVNSARLHFPPRERLTISCACSTMAARCSTMLDKAQINQGIVVGKITKFSMAG